MNVATKTSVILKIDTPSFSGLTYPRPLVAALVDEFNNGKLPLMGTWIPKSGTLVSSSTETSHIVQKLEIAGNDLVAVIQTLPNKLGKEIADTIASDDPKYDFRATGYGVPDENGVLTEFHIASVDFVCVEEEVVSSEPWGEHC